MRLPATMRAVVLDAPGPPEALAVRDAPVPRAGDGWVLLRVRAFGINRSELHLRHGVARNARFPVIPGIEAAGEVVAAPGGEFAVGTTTVTCMGGMGREFDGGYAEYVAVPAGQVIPFASDLPWATVGAPPEMLQTAYGSITLGTETRAGQTLLVRGGTSAVGLAIALLARRRGARVLATSRREDGLGLLRERGVDVPLLDDGAIAERVRAEVPGGVDGAVELVGTRTLRDTLRCVRPGGTVCFTGMLSDEWTIPEFYPQDYLPNGVRLTAYHGEASDLPGEVLAGVLNAVAAGDLEVPVGHVYDGGLADVVQAHRDMEAGTFAGKLVVVL